MVLVSSVSVYGEGSAALDEGRDARPRSSYGVSKLYAEQLGALWAQVHDRQLTIARLTQVYGPGTDPRNGIYRMLREALGGRSVRVTCRPGMLRDYLHAEDAARLLLELLDQQGGGILNVMRVTRTMERQAAANEEKR